MHDSTPIETNEAPVFRIGMTTEEFLASLKERKIYVHANGERLRVSAPAGAVDAALQAELKARKGRLLEYLRQGETSAGIVPLSAEERCGRIPLTPAQQGIWLIDHFNPGDAAYNIPEAFRLELRVELETLQAAVDRLMQRHSILRTSFHEDDGELFQSVAEWARTPVGFSDLSALREAESERICQETIRAEGQKPFDLKRTPLVRFHLFRLGEFRHVIFVNVHHILADRVSLYVIREEVTALAKAIHFGRDAGLPEVRLQFADYAVWATRQMKGEAVQRQVAYWKKSLAGLGEPIELPLSKPRPEKRSSRGATKVLSISASDRTALNRIGTQEGASAFMTFLALFAVTLARWSQHANAAGEECGMTDFCIGSPITHRRQAGTERMIGMFVNMLAFRCRIAPTMSFRELLRQVRETALEAYDNSDVPFQQLVKALNPDRRSRRSPIFQVMFGYETYLPPVAEEMQIDAGPGIARYDLSLLLAETANEGLFGLIEYCTDLFDEGEIETLAKEIEATAARVLAAPDEALWSMARVVANPPKLHATETAETSDVDTDAGKGSPGTALLRAGRLFFSRR